MANSEFIDILSPRALADIEKLNSELVKTLGNVKEVNKNLIGANTPSGSDSAIKDLNQQLLKQEKLMQELQKRYTQLAQTKQQSNQRTSQEIVNQRALAQSADRQARATSALVGAYAQLNARHQQAKKTLQDLIASQTASNAEIRKAQREFDKLDKRIMAADRSVRVFNRNVGNYPRQAVAGLTSLLSAFGLVGGVYLFASVIKDAFKVTKEFDKATADLAATMGKSRKEIKALTDSAKQFGATTVWTATQVTQLQKELGKLGFSEKEVLLSTKGILSLASAVDTDLQTAAEVGGSTLRAFNLDASEMGRVVDVMAKSFTSSALDISNFRESIKYVAPVAAASNVTIEQTTALLGVLADNGIKGSMAGTSLRRIMTDIVRTGKPFNEGLREIVKNGISVKDAFDEVGRTAQTSLVVLGNNIEKIDSLSKSLDNAAGSAQRMADEQLNSLNGKILLLTSAWDGFILSLNKGEGRLSGMLIGAIDLMTKFVKAWEYAFAGRVERNTIVMNNVIEKGTGEFENRLLEKKNQLLKEQVLIQNKIRIAEKEIQLNPDNQSAITNLNALRERGKAIETQLSKEEEYIKSFAKTMEETWRQDATRSMEQALALEKRIIELKEIIANPGNLRAKNQALLELEQVKQEFTKVNNQTKYFNALILTAGKHTEKIKKDLIQTGDVGIMTPDELKELEKLAKEKAKLQEEELQRLYKLQRMKLESEKRYFDELASDEGMYREERESFILDSLNKEIEIATLAREEGLRQAKGNRTQEKIIWEEFYKDFESIVKSSESRILKIRSDSYKEWEDMVNKFEGEGLRLDLFGDDPAGQFEQWRKKATETGQTWQDIYSDWSNVALYAINTVQMAQDAMFQNRLNQLEKERDTAILFAGESEAARAEIDRQYDRKRNAILRKQAQQEKAFAIVQSIINTATAVIKALPNIPLSVAVGTIGLTQTAIIASQQIPQFFKGTDNAPEGLAWTDERGAELHTDKDGNIKDFGSKKGARVKFLEKGDKIFTAQKTKQIMFNNQLNEILQGNRISNSQTINNIDFSPLRSDIQNLGTIIKNKSEIQYVIDKQGERVYRKEQGVRQHLVSNRLRIKS